jgi:hypothetical protein
MIDKGWWVMPYTVTVKKQYIKLDMRSISEPQTGVAVRDFLSFGRKKYVSNDIKPTKIKPMDIEDVEYAEYAALKKHEESH